MPTAPYNKVGIIRIMKKLIHYTFLALVLLAVSTANAQEVSKPTIVVPNHGISFALGGAIPIGFSLDYMLSNRLSLELILGAGYSGGFKYYFRDPTIHRLNAFTGLFYTSTEFSQSTDSLGVSSQGIQINGNSLYIPIGLSYLGKKNFQYSLEVGAFITQDQLEAMIGLKVGHRFSVDYEKIKNTEKTSKKNILSGSLFGMTPLIGITYERLLAPFLGIDLGVGLPSVGAGFKLYAPQIREDKWNLHIGASHHFFVFPWAGGWKTYFPIGLNRMAENGYRISFDLGPQISWYENIGSNYNLTFNGNLRIGKAF